MLVACKSGSVSGFKVLGGVVHEAHVKAIRDVNMRILCARGHVGHPSSLLKAQNLQHFQICQPVVVATSWPWET